MSENIPALRVVPPERHIRFGPFEVDSRAGELRKHGIKIRIGQQSFQILLMILKRPGEVVLREEIRQKLWPLDTVVEFDHSINAAIQKLRDALGESADNPRSIETLPRRGYRFIGTVEMPPAELVIEEPLIEPASVKMAPRKWSSVVFAAAIAILTLLALAGWLRRWEAPAPVRNVTASLGAFNGSMAVSPDGTAVLYSDSHGLFLRRLDSLEETPVYTHEGLNDQPLWSPDGLQTVFVTSLGLIRVSLPNGPPAVLWPKIPVTRGFAWAPDGSILAAIGQGTPEGGRLFLVPKAGGTPARLEVPGLTDGRFYYPEFLPDGKNILFAWAAGNDELGLYLATLEKGKLTRGPILLRKNMTAGRYAPAGGGRILYVQDDKLYAQKLNIRRGTLEGEPELVVNGVLTTLGSRRGIFSVSRNGVLVWKAGRAALAQLTWFDRKGKILGTAGPPCLPELLLSPDEKQVLAYTVTDHIGFSVVEANHSGSVSLPARTITPVWMPDSSHILYSRREGGSHLILERAVEGGDEKELARVPELNKLLDISADGKAVIYKWQSKLYALRLDAPEIAKPQMVAETFNGRFSPDGRWVVYSAGADRNHFELYAQPFPSGGLRTQLTSAGGDRPIWRADGKEILYLNGSTICSLRVEVKGNAIHASPPEALFDVRVPNGIVGDEMPIAVTRDGSRILFAQAVEQPNPQLTYVMTAWDTLLRR
jgi:DNA-binding winged helix-turn-helix (wHTH) protein/Tol biopolymer transport system component